MVRKRLENRRENETFTFLLDGVKFFATVSYTAEGQLGEIFLDICRAGADAPGLVGTALDIMAKDLATLASLALQHGVPLRVIREALSQELDGTMRGPLGRTLELLEPL